VLHEFGHVLGLVHQHQNPAAAISWNQAAVMRDLLTPAHCWSIDDIQHNVFNPTRADIGAMSEMDPHSIMGPVIPASWTTNGYSIDFNTDLSEMEKRFIRSMYPE
jgi:hypothetical protein